MGLPTFGAPMNPDMGGGPGGDPSAAPGPGGAPGAGAPPDGQDATSSGIQAVMGKIRALGQMAQDIGQSVPALQAESQQIQAMIRRMVIKAGQTAPTQTDSASALPTG